MIRFFAGPGGVIICLFVLWNAFNYLHHLRLVPPDMNVALRIYATEKTFGFGPGGNETGFIVYRMPAKTQKKIEEDGLVWLEELERRKRTWKGNFGTWFPTPVDLTNEVISSQWPRYDYPEECGNTGVLADYLDRYGFCIPIRKTHLDLANHAMTTPGNYFAFGGAGGLIILIPEQRRIVFIYVG